MATAHLLMRPILLGYMVGRGSSLGRFGIALINTNVLDPSSDRTSARNKHQDHEGVIARLTKTLRA